VTVVIVGLLACSHQDSGPAVKPEGGDTGTAPDSSTGESNSRRDDPDSGDTEGSNDSDSGGDSGPIAVVCDRTLGWKFVAAGYLQTCGIHTDGCAEC
jgi:hypothetical protein